MENHRNSANNAKQDLSSVPPQPLFQRNPNFPPDSSPPSAPPPSYTGPSQFPSPNGMVCLQYYPPSPQGMAGYPQPQVPPPYYPLPGAVYSEPQTDIKYPEAQMEQQLQQQQQRQQQQEWQQQQKQQFIVTSNLPPGVGPADTGPPVSIIGAFVLSFIVYFIGGFVCGATAFTFAIIAKKSAASGNRNSAVQLRNISCAISIFGILAVMALVAIYLGVFLSPAFNSEPWHLDLSPFFNSSYYYYDRR